MDSFITPVQTPLPSHFSTIIIGGGPAGLMAAISAGNESALLIERGPKPGRKLLITAAGQANITHRGTVPELLACYNGKERFLRTALYEFSNEDLIRFFEDRYVPTYYDEKDRCLPQSLSARDILHSLILTVEKNKVIIHLNDAVIAVEKKENTKPFRVITKLRDFTCDRLILATGGKSFPKTGSRGDGFSFARELGHTIIEPRPALTGIESDNLALRSLSGLSFDDLSLELFRNNKMAGRYRGNLLVTHKGISGPVIINNSRSMYEGDEIRINFINKSRESLNGEIVNASGAEGKKSLGSFLKNKNIPRKLLPFLMSPEGGVPGSDNSRDFEKPLAQLTKKERIRLLRNLTAYPVKISRLQGWDTAMVTTGGVDTKEINPKSMESRLVPRLYFAGEIMDVDGDSGGYNLQAAFSTGRLAGSSCCQ